MKISIHNSRLFPGRNPLIKRAQNGNSCLFCAIVLAMFALAGCQKQDSNSVANDPALESKNEARPGNEVLNQYRGLNWRTLWQLQQARAATAKYRNINNALDDGYADINVVVPNMGYHFLKTKLVDSVFDFRRPELLVYNKDLSGMFHLLAVEYGVPIDLTPDKAPEGFAGTADVWNRDEDHGLWTVHAWVWDFNPAGVFNPTNPLVQVH